LKDKFSANRGVTRSPFETFSSGAGDETADSSTFWKGARRLDDPNPSADDSDSDSFDGRPGSRETPPSIPSDNRDWALLASEEWSGNPGHGLTYFGLFLFTFILYFRPYELIPSLSDLSAIAFIVALATLLIYVPSQLAAEGSLTAMPVEVKCVLFLTAWALITVPFAKSPNLAWEKFDENFSKVAIIFVVMVNALRSIPRLKGLIWLGIAVGVYLSIEAVNLYMAGKFDVEGYRVKVDFGGMFGNPNDMAIHLIMFIPISIGLGMVSRSLVWKLLYYASAAFMTAAVMVTQSRGAFLGLVSVAVVLVWKFGKESRLKISLISIVIGTVVMLLAPGNYGRRVLSIFMPSLDPVGSSDHRWELLMRSFLVTARNPFGIGIGNFSIVGQHNQETHNAYTQVSAELGWIALFAYMMLLIMPLRRLGALERVTSLDDRRAWFNTMSKVVFASIVGYMVASFFGAVAYNWYIYYPVAFAVCLRRLYQNDLERAGAER